ncbi:MAG TPA: hypothetical protein VL551_22510 [Actinospica sp.]|jgi:hypothetical protein|nr:hypothetical protein [Actinospica sp.]
MPDESPATPLHFTRDGGAVCGTRLVVGGDLFRASFDEDDTDIDCPLCRMYLRGLRAGRSGAR